MMESNQRTVSPPTVPAFDREAALQRVMRLMAIPGKSCEEAGIAAAVVEELKNAGVRSEQIFFDTAHTRTRRPGEVGNLFLRLPGTLPGPVRMFSAHLDTVPICVGCQPESTGATVRSKDSNTGLGADNRAGVAVLLNTALTLLQDQIPHPPLLFCWFVQEEIGLEGARHLDTEPLAQVQWACNFDGSAPHKLTVGATSGQRLEISVRGRAAHAGVAPQDGISAIVIAAKAIANLHAEGWLGRVEKPEGKGTANVGIFHGGDATNVITPEVTLRAEARSHHLPFCHRIADVISEAFQQAASSVCNAAGQCGTVEISRRVDYESFKLDESSAAVQTVRAAVVAAGREPMLAVSDGGLDANWLVRHGIPTVTLGCGQRNVHTTEETLDIEDYYVATSIALALASQVPA
jgi:tripeptide aminopeptidase